jgi:thioredoxin reductase (NADPH)
LPVQQIPETLTRTKAQSRPETVADVLVVGAGPTGMACAIEAQKAGFKSLIIDKGCLVNSIYHYPNNMVFFTTPELLEIGDVPFTTASAKPNRLEALEYYRRVAEHYHLHIRQYEWVKTITGEDRDFRVTTTDRHDAIHDYRARKIVVATGYYDLANKIGIPGEDQEKVFHYYREPHPYFDTDVLVIGGKNSAAEAALDLWRHGARVTLVHRGSQMHNHVKYWVRPDIENRIKAGEIAAHFNSTVQEIGPDFVVLRTPEGPIRMENDFVFALTGYHPGLRFSAQCRHRTFLRADASGLRPGEPGIERSGNLCGGSHRCRIEDQRNLHRKWPLPRQTDRQPPQRKAGPREPKFSS